MSRRFADLLREQARNHFGTPGMAKSFLRGAQVFKLCPISVNYAQHIFQGGRSSPGYGPVRESVSKVATRFQLNVRWCTSEAFNYEKHNYNGGHDDFLLICIIGYKKHIADLAHTASRFSLAL